MKKLSKAILLTLLSVLGLTAIADKIGLSPIASVALADIGERSSGNLKGNGRAE